MVKPLFSMVLAAMAVTGALGTHSVWAQGGEQPQWVRPTLEDPSVALPAGSNRTVTIQLKNVTPRIVAWWLDPGRTEEPIHIRMSHKSAAGVFPDPVVPSGFETTLKALPQGIESVVALDSRPALQVVGTESGIAELRKIIEERDKPIQQVEVQVRYYQIPAKEVKKLPITAAPEGAISGPLTMGMGSDALINQLDVMASEKKISILTAPQVVAIDGLTAAVRTSESFRANVSYLFKDKTVDVPEFHSIEKGYAFNVGVSRGITVKPTFHEDGTFNLMLAPGRVLELTDNTSNEAVWLRGLDGVVNINNLNDGDVIALMGADTRYCTSVLQPEKKPSNLLMVLRARVLRRAG